MNNGYIKFRFVNIVGLEWHRYSVMVPTIETVDDVPTLVHIEVCSISFN